MNDRVRSPALAPAAADEVVAGRSGHDPLRDWDWEAIRADGKLHLFCYLRGNRVVALTPFDFAE